MNKLNVGILATDEEILNLKNFICTIEQIKWYGYFSLTSDKAKVTASIKKINDFEKFSQQIAAFVVFTNNEEYLPFIKKLIKQGKNLFIVKPYLFFSSFSENFIKLFKESQIVYFLGSNYRYHPLIEKFKAAIFNPTYIEINFSTGLQTNNNKKLFENLVNIIDLVHFLTTSKIKNLSIIPIISSNKSYSLLNLNIDFPNDLNVKINVDNYNNKSFFQMKVLKKDAVYDFDFSKNSAEVYELENSLDWHKTEHRIDQEPTLEIFKTQLLTFLQLTANNIPNLEEEIRFYKLVEFYKILNPKFNL